MYRSRGKWLNCSQYHLPHTKLALACMSDRDAIESALVTDSQKYIEDNVSIVNCMDIHLFAFPPSKLFTFVCDKPWSILFLHSLQSPSCKQLISFYKKGRHRQKTINFPVSESKKNPRKRFILLLFSSSGCY